MPNQSPNLSSQPLPVPGAGKGLRRFVEEIGHGVMASAPRWEMSRQNSHLQTFLP